MKDVSWINHPELKNVDARKMKYIINLLNEVEGKPIESAIPAIMRVNQDLKRQGLSFTPQEQNAIINIIKKDLPQDQRSKIDMMMSMMNLKKW